MKKLSRCEKIREI